MESVALSGQRPVALPADPGAVTAAGIRAVSGPPTVDVRSAEVAAEVVDATIRADGVRDEVARPDDAGPNGGRASAPDTGGDPNRQQPARESPAEAVAARARLGYGADGLASMIYQMGGAERSSAKGLYIDIRV